MKTFLIRATIFGALQMAIASIVLTNYYRQINYGYMASFEDKLTLLKEHHEPSIIVLGGSNVAFGIDSKKLNQQLGYPVINAGLHSALGLDFYLDIADRYVRHGDTVILIPEWDLLAGNFGPQELQLQQLLRQSPTSWNLYLQSENFSAKSFLDDFALPELAHAVQSGMKIRSAKTVEKLVKTATTPGIYSRLNFNENGDFVGHHGLGSIKEIDHLSCSLMFHPKNYQRAVEKFNALATTLHARGATVYLAYAPLPEKFYKKYRPDILKGHNYLSRHLAVPILHHPRETNYPSRLFFDTVYHLNQIGKTKRTDLIVSSLHQQIRLAQSKSSDIDSEPQSANVY